MFNHGLLKGFGRPGVTCRLAGHGQHSPLRAGSIIGVFCLHPILRGPDLSQGHSPSLPRPSPGGANFLPRSHPVLLTASVPLRGSQKQFPNQGAVSLVIRRVYLSRAAPMFKSSHGRVWGRAGDTGNTFPLFQKPTDSLESHTESKEYTTT